MTVLGKLSWLTTYGAVGAIDTKTSNYCISGRYYKRELHREKGLSQEESLEKLIAVDVGQLKRRSVVEKQ